MALLDDMALRFTKMHGIGNDFVMLDATEAPLPDHETIRRIADRRFGIGCDQVLVAVRPRAVGCDLGVKVFNCDGSEAEQCGNGMRCMAVFARDRALVSGREMRFELRRGTIDARLEDGGEVSIDMGAPCLEPSAIPFVADARAPEYEIEANGETLEVGAVSMGNPHAVIAVDDVALAPVASLGPAVQRCGRFPEGVNVGFAQFESDRRIRLRVFERGVGETLACGSGACAAVVAGRVQGRVGTEVTVELPGGALTVRWGGGDGDTVCMTGPATFVFEGEIAA